MYVLNIWIPEKKIKASFLFCPVYDRIYDAIKTNYTE